MGPPRPPDPAPPEARATITLERLLTGDTLAGQVEVHGTLRNAGGQTSDFDVTLVHADGSPCQTSCEARVRQVRPGETAVWTHLVFPFDTPAGSAPVKQPMSIASVEPEGPAATTSAVPVTVVVTEDRWSPCQELVETGDPVDPADDLLVTIDECHREAVVRVTATAAVNEPYLVADVRFTHGAVATVNLLGSLAQGQSREGTAWTFRPGAAVTGVVERVRAVTSVTEL
jgi:hypothetical protein